MTYLTTNDLLKDIISLHGIVRLLGDERRLESNLDARILGANVAHAQLELDFRAKRFIIHARVDLIVKTLDTSFITERNWGNPRFRASTSAKIGSFRLVSLGFTGDKDAVRVKAAVTWAKVKVWFPSINTIDEGRIELRDLQPVQHGAL